MNKVNTKNKKTNRRLAFRIYEQVNLFYQKIEPDQILEPPEDCDNLMISFKPTRTRRHLVDKHTSQTRQMSSLPLSESNTNDTLNVNLSSTGIAFTTKDALVPNDYLALRILLLATMTSISICCKVVYCKPSNPFEDNQYPFLVGGEFINLTTADSQLLTAHLQKRKKQQIIIYSLLSMVLLTFLSVPDLAFGLLWDITNHVLVTILHAIHVVIELVELNIDHLVEHGFHTDVRQTQIIVFYIMLGFGFISIYIFWKTVPPLCIKFFKNQLRFWSRKKASLLYVWGEQSIFNKIKISGLAVTAIVGYVLFAM
ncbi:MAG: hypothetical protein CTY19_06680 [Methylomonas sp.]|nr:MAG: hypothetical protein CTY19_06680 [Methylomonas sp.]